MFTSFKTQTRCFLFRGDLKEKITGETLKVSSDKKKPKEASKEREVNNVELLKQKMHISIYK